MAKDHFEEIVSTIVLSGTVHKLVRQLSTELQISLVHLICSFAFSDYQIKPKGVCRKLTPYLLLMDQLMFCVLCSVFEKGKQWQRLNCPLRCIISGPLET